MGGGAHGFGDDFGSAFSDIFEGIFGMGGARRRSSRPRARRGPALQHGDHAGGGVRRQDRAGAAADLGDLRSLLRHRRQGRHQAEDLPALQRPRPHPPYPGRLLHAGAHLSDLPGPRPGDRGSVSDRARARAASRASARCRSTFRPASRTAPASGWPARARPASAAGRPATSIFSCRSPRTRCFSAMAPTCTAGCRSRW